MAQARTVTRNADGLNTFYGLNEGFTSKGGEYRTHGARRQQEVLIGSMADVGSSATILDDTTWVPAGAFVETVDLIVKTACVGVNAVLNIGFIRSDRATELDYNGLVAAVPVTSLATAGNIVTLTAGGGTYYGALLGTVLAFNGVFVADYDTAAFSSGSLIIRVNYSFL